MSKLQKWILCAVHKSDDGYIHKQDIYKGFYEVGQGIRRYHDWNWKGEYSKEKKKKANSAYVAVNVCLKRMREKDLIERFYSPSYESENDEFWLLHGHYLRLTEKGKQIAESLIVKLHMNHTNLNNKQKEA